MRSQTRCVDPDPDCMTNPVRSLDLVDAGISNIIWATGYNVSFPFLPQVDLTPGDDNTFPLFKRMVKPRRETLFFLGLAQPLPTLVNLAEQQSKFVVAALQGEYAFPEADEMAATIEADEREHMGHFYDSPRHRMQVDFTTYVADLHKETQRGADRLTPAR